VRAGHDHEWPVELRHLVEEDQRIDHAALGDVIVGAVGGVVLVPVPHVAVERRLVVDDELEDVDRFAEQFLDGAEHQRMADDTAEDVAVEVWVEHAAKRAPVLLQHQPRAVRVVNDAVEFVVDRRHLLRGQQSASKDVAHFLVLGDGRHLTCSYDSLRRSYRTLRFLRSPDGDLAGSRVDGDRRAVGESECAGGADDCREVELAGEHGGVGERSAFGRDDGAGEREHDVVRGGGERNHEDLAGFELGDGGLRRVGASDDAGVRASADACAMEVISVLAASQLVRHRGDHSDESFRRSRERAGRRRWFRSSDEFGGVEERTTTAVEGAGAGLAAIRCVRCAAEQCGEFGLGDLERVVCFGNCTRLREPPAGLEHGEPEQAEGPFDGVRAVVVAEVHAGARVGE
jgi:hypothetical protein